MKTPLKAALLSGLVMPGLGHIYLKRYGRGILLMLLVLSGFGYAIGTATMRALDSLQKMQRMGPVDMSALSNVAASSAAGPSDSVSNALMILVACCWLFSVIDAYRIGKSTGSSAGSPGKREGTSPRT